MKKIMVTQFEKDIINFIKSHPYLKQQDTEAEVTIEPQSEEPTITIPTVDGEYEGITIKFIYR
jgi:hypothetical protein